MIDSKTTTITATTTSTAAAVATAAAMVASRDTAQALKIILNLNSVDRQSFERCELKKKCCERAPKLKKDISEYIAYFQKQNTNIFILDVKRTRTHTHIYILVVLVIFGGFIRLAAFITHYQR